MTLGDAASTPLTWDVLTSKRPSLNRDVPPGQEKWAWVANSSTLIAGKRDAVLVDTFLTIAQSQTLLEWVLATGKNLRAIYVTHGHGDHFFGLAPLLERFPQARAVATPEVVEAMHAHLAPASIDGFWRKLFPGQIPDRLVSAEPLDRNELELEGQSLVVVNTGRTDTAHSTSLYAPSIGLIVAGDVVYNGIHPFFPKPTGRAGSNGSPPSTSLRPFTRRLSLPATRSRKTATIRAASGTRDSICATSTACSKRHPPRGSSTTGCWRSTPIGPILGRFGRQRRCSKAIPDRGYAMALLSTALRAASSW